jgi:hypothetical protein
MLSVCRTGGEVFAMSRFVLTRSDIDTFMDELYGFYTSFRD